MKREHTYRRIPQLNRAISKPWSGLFIIILGLAIIVGKSNTLAMGNQTVRINKQYPPQIDTFIAEGFPNTPRDEVGGLWIGYDQQGEFKTQRVFLQFNVDNIPPNSYIVSADLTLYLGGITGNDVPMPIKAERVISEWNKDITWSSQPNESDIDKEKVSITAVGSELGHYRWSVTRQLRKHLQDGGNPATFSIRLTGNEDVGQHERGFWASECTPAQCGQLSDPRPILNVSYLENTQLSETVFLPITLR